MTSSQRDPQVSEGNEATGMCERTPEIEMSLLRTMLLIRAFESNLPVLYDRGLIQGSAHAAIGQEAVAAGACLALRPGDYVTSTHRGHGHAIAKGADLRQMTAELLGRSTGICRGKGGSMHIADFGIRMLGANGIVGANFGIATGAALSVKLNGLDDVVLSFFGEGALNQGNFLECANMAKIWNLPVVFLCENNHFAMSARPEDMLAVRSIPDRARAFGIEGVDIDGMDADVVYDAVALAVAAARRGEGPQFIAAECYRFEGHFSGDAMGYRDSTESDLWKQRDPLVILATRLMDEGVVTSLELDAMKTEAAQQVQAALDLASEDELPAASQAREDLYA
jgi:TPP-dependent pyruvate/acetoin dehydrogenase alpha subunit